MDENTKIVLIALIGTFAGSAVTISTAYIAARWHISRHGNNDGGDDDNKTS